MFNKQDKNEVRRKKQIRVRSKVVGTAERPRLNVYRSLTNIFTQVIDDSKGITICSCSTKDKDIASKIVGKTKVEQAFFIGTEVAKKAIKKGIKEVVFDRAGYIYTGRIQKVAEGARNAGLKF